MAEGQDSHKKITVNIKTPKDKHSVEIEEDAPIKDVSVFRKGFSLIANSWLMQKVQVHNYIEGVPRIFVRGALQC